MATDEDSSSVEKDEEEQLDEEEAEDEGYVEVQTKKQRPQKQPESLVKSRSFSPSILAPPVKLVIVRNFDANIASIKPIESKVRTSGNILNVPVSLKTLVSFDRQLSEFLPNDNRNRSQQESSLKLLKPITLITNSSLDKTPPDVKQLEANKISSNLDTNKPLFPKYVCHMIMNLDRNYSTKLFPAQSIELETTAQPSVPSGGEAAEEEPPDFLELVFGSGAGRLRGKASHVILFLDSSGSSYLDLLQEICLRVYRELGRGTPRIRHLTLDDEWNKYIQRQLGQNERMVSIDLDSLKDKLKTNVQLRNRFEEFCRQDLGFIILRTSDPQTFVHYKEELANIRRESNELVSPIVLEARTLPESFANFIWANSLEGTLEGKFDEIFNRAKQRYKERMALIQTEEKGDFKTSTGRWESEGQEHYDMKAFVVRFLVNKLRRQNIRLDSPEKIRQNIATEEKETELDSYPDVKDKVNSQFYEIETLFGQGHATDKKIDETIRRLSEVEQSKINIVMDNLAFLIHLQDLKRIRRAFPHVHLFTLSFEKEGTLVPFREVQKMIRAIQ